MLFVLDHQTVTISSASNQISRPVSSTATLRDASISIKLNYNGRGQGEADDATLWPAIMNVWLHPASPSKELRKSLLGQQLNNGMPEVS
jgi:hypothetical protein